MVQCEWQACALSQISCVHVLSCRLQGLVLNGPWPSSGLQRGGWGPCSTPYNEQKQSSSISSQRQMFEIQAGMPRTGEGNLEP